MMLGIIIAIISGALMSIQGVFNTNFSKQTNVWFSNLFIQLTAFIMCLVMLLVTKSGMNIGKLFHLNDKYILLGGILGAFITLTVIKSISLLGTAKAIMIIVVAQLVVAYCIELFGIFNVEKVGFEVKKLIGVIIAIIGIIIFKV